MSDELLNEKATHYTASPERRAWLARVFDARWSAPRWPEEWFGRALSNDQARIIEREFARVKAPGTGQDRTNLWANTLLSNGQPGLKEKLIAAHRGGIDTVIVPKENEKDLKDLPAVIKKNLKIIIAEHMDEVLRNALAVPNPDHFLEDADGIHEIEDIYIAPGGLARATAEVPHPAGVN